MFRWGLVVVGVWAVYSSLSWWGSYEPADEEKHRVGLEQAMALVEERAERFVVVEGELNADKRIYESGLVEPRYASRAADDVEGVDLNDPRAFVALGRQLGCAVSARGRLAPPAMIIEHIQEVTDHEDNSKTRTVLNQRVLASVAGTGGGVFVLSEPLRDPDESKNLEWLLTTEFEGKVCLLSQLKQNLRGPRAQFNDPAMEMAGQGYAVAPGAVVILVGAWGGDTSSCYVPVAGSGDALLVRVAEGQEHVLNGRISGTLKPIRGQALAGLSRLLGLGRVSPVSAILPRTAAEINTAARWQAMIGAGFGLGCLAWGGFLIWRRHQAKTRAQRDAQLCEMISLEGSMLTESSGV